MGVLLHNRRGSGTKNTAATPERPSSGHHTHHMPVVSRGAPGLFLLHLICGKRHRLDVLKLR